MAAMGAQNRRSTNGTVMTTVEAAAALDVTPAWIWRLIKRGSLAAEKRGRDYWIEEEEVERYRREKAPAHRPRKNDEQA